MRLSILTAKLAARVAPVHQGGQAMDIISANVFLTANIMLLLMILALRIEIRQLRDLVCRLEQSANVQHDSGAPDDTEAPSA